jgi:hypothetical protein
MLAPALVVVPQTNGALSIQGSMRLVAAAHFADLQGHAAGVWVGRSTDHEIKDIYIRTDAAAAIWFDATIDRIADLTAMAPVDSYEIPDRLREATHLRSPVDLSPTPPTPPAAPTSTIRTPTPTPTPPDHRGRPGSTTSPR